MKEKVCLSLQRTWIIKTATWGMALFFAICLLGVSNTLAIDFEIYCCCQDADKKVSIEAWCPDHGDYEKCCTDACTTRGYGGLYENDPCMEWSGPLQDLGHTAGNNKSKTLDIGEPINMAVSLILRKAH